MEKPLDKINDAFNGKMGKGIESKVRKRLYWIMENVEGEKVLDIGCSQGITAILLGREGKRVTAIDSLSDSIKIAKEELIKEEESTKRNVEFINDNIINFSISEKDFDTIILGEVLEHFADWNALLKKAYDLGSESCNYIITVPFGINDYFDHKRTYYYQNLIVQLNKYFNIKETSFMGKWVGVTCTKSLKKEKIEKFPLEIIRKMETNFYNIERDLLNRNSTLTSEKNKLKEKVKILEAEIIKLKNSEVNKDFNLKYEKDKKVIGSEISSIKDIFNEQILKWASVNFELDKLKMQLEKVNKLNEILTENELLKKDNKEYINQINIIRNEKNIIIEKNKSLDQELKNMSKKYISLSNSKLGRLTLKHWKYKNRRRS